MKISAREQRFQVPGGEIKQTFSHYQQKIMWQYFWGFFPLVRPLVQVGVAAGRAELDLLHRRLQVLRARRGGFFFESVSLSWRTMVEWLLSAPCLVSVQAAQASVDARGGRLEPM